MTDKLTCPKDGSVLWPVRHGMLDNRLLCLNCGYTVVVERQSTELEFNDR